MRRRQEEHAERRRAPRIATPGNVVLHAPVVAHGRIVDLSASGVRLQLDPDRARDGDDAPPEVDLDLRFDAIDADWQRFRGRVVREAPDGNVAIAFEQVPRDFEDRIQDQILDRLEATMPLEPSAYLGEAHTHVGWIAIADSFPEPIASDLRSFLTDPRHA